MRFLALMVIVLASISGAIHVAGDEKHRKINNAVWDFLTMAWMVTWVLTIIFWALHEIANG